MSKKEIYEFAAQIKKQLGKGWTSHTWYNLGWRVMWYNGVVSLQCDTETKMFWAMVGNCGMHGVGHPDLLPSKIRRTRDPRKAILKACQYAQQVFERDWKAVMSSVSIVILQIKGDEACQKSSRKSK